MEASDLEVGRDEVSYTYRTLELLADQDPDGERFFLLGADMAAGWQAGGSRSGWWFRPTRGRAATGCWAGGGAFGPRAPRCRRSGRDNRHATCGVSSTTVRERAREGKPLRHLVPDPVLELIESGGCTDEPRCRVESEALAGRLAEIANDKKASDLVALVRGLVGYTDFLVICTARNERQAKAIHDEVYHQIKRGGCRRGWRASRRGSGS